MPDPTEHTPAGARPPAYHAFLVRVWRTSPNARWHASIQRATGEPAMHFAGIDLFIAFLLTQFGEDSPATLPPPTGDRGDRDGAAAAQPEDSHG